jgi:methylmalonyl-CoA decarboxylase subunit alpha
MLADVQARHRVALSGHEGSGGEPSARQNVERLLDAGTFYEIGVLAATPQRGGDGAIAGARHGSTVCGFGRIDGRVVAVAAEGPILPSTGAARAAEKPKSGWNGYIERLAREYRLPLVLLLDGLGGANSFTPHGYRYAVSGMRTDVLFGLLQQSPVVVGVLGDVAGVAATRVVASHFSVMHATRGRVLSSSPTDAAALDPSTAAALGGTDTQVTRAGNVDNAAADDEELFAQIRRFLSFLPSNVYEAPPHTESDDPADRRCDEIVSMVPDNRRRPYDARRLVECVVDTGSFFEIAPTYGRALVAGLARVNGQPAGVFASNPRHLAAAMDLAASEKQTRLAELCDTFHLPILYFADVPGFMIGVDAERSGLMRRGVRALQAIHRARVPVFTIQVRRSYGLAGNATGAPNHLSVKIAWPIGEWGDMPIEGGVDALYRKELAAAEDPVALRSAIEKRMVEEASIWRTADAFGVEDIIDPRDTRRVITRWVEAATQHPRLGRQYGPQYRP